jgi:hypothetical protein
MSLLKLVRGRESGCLVELSASIHDKFVMMRAAAQPPDVVDSLAI